MELLYPDYGRIESFKFVGMDESMAYGRVAVFKVIHQKKGVKAMTFNTHGDMFYTFSFNDTSDEIVKMVESK